MRFLWVCRDTRCQAWTPAFAGVTLCRGLRVAAGSCGLLPYQLPTLDNCQKGQGARLIHCRTLISQR